MDKIGLGIIGCGDMAHFADLACYFIDKLPVRVIATGSKLANNVITITFDDGSIVSIFESAVGSFGYPKELIEIYHRGAVIVIDHLIELRVAGIVDEPFKRTFPSGIEEAVKSTVIILKAEKSLHEGCAQDIKPSDFLI